MHCSCTCTSTQRVTTFVCSAWTTTHEHKHTYTYIHTHTHSYARTSLARSLSLSRILFPSLSFSPSLLLSLFLSPPISGPRHLPRAWSHCIHVPFYCRFPLASLALPAVRLICPFLPILRVFQSPCGTVQGDSSIRPNIFQNLKTCRA